MSPILIFACSYFSCFTFFTFAYDSSDEVQTDTSLPSSSSHQSQRDAVPVRSGYGTFDRQSTTVEHAEQPAPSLAQRSLTVARNGAKWTAKGILGTGRIASGAASTLQRTATTVAPYLKTAYSDYIVPGLGLLYRHALVPGAQTAWHYVVKPAYTHLARPLVAKGARAMLKVLDPNWKPKSELEEKNDGGEDGQQQHQNRQGEQDSTSYSNKLTSNQESQEAGGINTMIRRRIVQMKPIEEKNESSSESENIHQRDEEERERARKGKWVLESNP